MRNWPGCTEMLHLSEFNNFSGCVIYKMTLLIDIQIYAVGYNPRENKGWGMDT